METFNPPRKDNCYTFQIQNMDIWKETVESYYHSDNTNDNNWEQRKNGKTLLTRYKNTSKDISLTVTLHITTGTVCIQGSNKSLDAWIDHHSQPLMREYHKNINKCETQTTTISPEGNKPSMDDVSKDECADTDLALDLPIIPIDNESHETEDCDSNDEDANRTVIELEKTVPYELVDYLSSSNHTPEENNNSMCTSPTRPQIHILRQSACVSFRLHARHHNLCTPQQSHRKLCLRR